ncbi:DUF1365 domain-containing protein [Brevundimonas bacteroides]|uniref:DUF1365 domain-containing protein n=1 Tax=Brevundimonas bacteroides TaxID=74311 RepID=UPI00068F3B72|nr:DUF1365 family protein [Brevundimonas bacteroides]
MSGESDRAAQQGVDALYVGEVVHQRTAGFEHRLRYGLYMLLLDINGLDQAVRRLRLLRPGRFGLMSFTPRDHGDRSGAPLRGQIEAHLAAAGIDIQGGAIRLLTMPRILGYGFNPLSVYFCHRPDGSVAALVYEVTNTFQERHSYLVAVPEGAPVSLVRQTTEKRFFVSPYMDQALTYDFTVRPPGEAVSVVVAVRRGETPILTASFAGRRRPLTDAELLRAFVTHPLLTWKVTFGIHWEALKMMLKGAQYRHRGRPPGDPVSLGHARSPPATAIDVGR